MKIPLNSAAQVMGHMRSIVENAVSKGFKFVLENKHLYQNYEINAPTFKDVFGETTKLMHYRVAEQECKKMLSYRWDHAERAGARTLPSDEILFQLPTIKIYCAKCKRVEAFNPLALYDVLSQGTNENYRLYGEQLFLLIYCCQSCKDLPEVFLVRRKGWKLNLAGRSPIERIMVESYIPKDFSNYISDAMLAFNSNQTLAGLFLLRVFIEQFTKSVAGEGKADVVILRYSDGLPTVFKDRFPSLYKIYSDLSDAVHRAKADEELFKTSLKEINEHFDAKRVFKIRDDVPVPGTPPPVAPG